MALSVEEREAVPTYKFGRMDRAQDDWNKVHNLPNYPMPSKNSAIAAMSAVYAHKDFQSLGPVKARAMALYGDLFNDRRSKMSAQKPISAGSVGSAPAKAKG